MCVNLHIKILSFFQQLACYPHPRSTTVSLETFTLYTAQVLIPVLVILALYFKIPVTSKHVPLLLLSTQALSRKTSELHA